MIKLSFLFLNQSPGVWRFYVQADKLLMKPRLLLFFGFLTTLISCSVIFLSRLEVNTYTEEIYAKLKTYYLRENQIDDKFKTRLASNTDYVNTITDLHESIRFTLRSLNDLHTDLITPEKVRNIGFANDFGFLAVSPERIIVRVYPNSSAKAVELKVGDSIVAANGIPPMTGMPLYSLKSRYLALTVRRIGLPEPITLNLKRGVYSTDVLPSIRFVRDTNVGYIDLPDQNGENSQKLQDYVKTIPEGVERMQNQKHVCGWVLDLRRNSGGWLGLMLTAVSPFLDTDPVGFSVYRNKTSEAWEFSKSTTRLKTPEVPIAILQSRLTASAAEGIIIALVGRRNTKSFGEFTAGVPTIPHSYPLSDKAMLSVTEAYMADRYKWIYDAPIAPDQEIKPDWTTLNEMRDPILSAALKWLHIQQSCVKKRP
jgi:carboxyl-terminal processing protease